MNFKKLSIGFSFFLTFSSLTNAMDDEGLRNRHPSRTSSTSGEVAIEVSPDSPSLLSQAKEKIEWACGKASRFLNLGLFKAPVLGEVKVKHALLVGTAATASLTYYFLNQPIETLAECGVRVMGEILKRGSEDAVTALRETSTLNSHTGEGFEFADLLEKPAGGLGWFYRVCIQKDDSGAMCWTFDEVLNHLKGFGVRGLRELINKSCS